MIQLEGIQKRFGALEVIPSLDLVVRRQEWLGVFGHNGSGKTTLIRILLGLSKPTGGRLLLDGSEPDNDAWREFRRKLGFMPERITFYENLTGAETLLYFSRLRGLTSEDLAPMLERVGLSGAAHRKVGEYSKGMRQRLNLAQALLGDPEVLVLDEPIEGLDPQGVRDFFRLLREGNIGTVVLSSHRLAETCDEVDRVCVLDRGQVKAEGTVQELVEKIARPAKILIYPTSAANGRLDEALGQLGAISLTTRDGVLVAEVPQEQKTAFLLGLNDHREAIRHLHVEEPSLEEIYFDAD